jgi:predicted flap endonuclease-1-like 5' DNA nuclease
MPTHREPDLPGRARNSSEESAVRRAPLEHEDAYELQDHEFTLEPEEPTIQSATPLDERTAPWSTMPPLPPWADTARALLEPGASQARNDAVFYDDEPTHSGEPVDCSTSELVALREELSHARQQIDLLERELAETRRSARAVEAQLERHNAELLGQVKGQAFVIAELQQCAPPSAQITAVLPALPQADDLQRIRGLGKRFVERLAQIGVRQFAQIAAWSPADVAQIAPQLGVRPKRIQREGWIKQAQKLSERTPRVLASLRAQTAAPRRTRKAKPASSATERKAPGRKRAAR